MASLRTGLTDHRDYPNSPEDISGLEPQDDQVITADEIVKIAQAVDSHADEIDELPRINDESSDASVLWSAEKIVEHVGPIDTDYVALYEASKSNEYNGEPGNDYVAIYESARLSATLAEQ